MRIVEIISQPARLPALVPWRSSTWATARSVKVLSSA